MLTKYTIIPADSSMNMIERDVEWPYDPGYERIAPLVEPMLHEFGGKNMMEHVSVWLTPDFNPGPEGFRTDMFVDEMGLIDGLPRNDRATRIYRANWLTQHPETPPEGLSYIAGPAILFHRRVWF